MVILKRVKGATLMETLIATVLIMVIFVVASLILNNLFSNRIKHNTRSITAKLNEIEYLYINDKLSLPYHDDYDGWAIDVVQSKNQEEVNLRATKKHPSKTIEKLIYP
ncbi:type IV pilus modification PilV family protein [Winogradskyella sp.]|uniref:type IV pilus modification PilV family protein n=1 Tax=Winogradskyella sp. TaxID=1883156 RepID=UPI003BACD03F